MNEENTNDHIILSDNDATARESDELSEQMQEDDEEGQRRLTLGVGTLYSADGDSANEQAENHLPSSDCQHLRHGRRNGALRKTTSVSFFSSFTSEPEVVDREELDRRVSQSTRRLVFSEECYEENYQDMKKISVQETIKVEGNLPSLKELEKVPDGSSIIHTNATTCSRTRIASRISTTAHVAMTHLFGDNYSSKESAYVIAAGGLIAFNVGFVNGSCMSGFLNPQGIRQSVAGFTASYTVSALSVASGQMETFGDQSSIILSYIFGNFLSGIMTPDPTPYQLEPSYGPTFLIGGMFLMAASVLAHFEVDAYYVFCFAAAANGITNGIASIYSANLIRCAITGATTDVGLILAELVRSRFKNVRNLSKGIVLAMILSFFWLGGFVSYYATKRFLAQTLFFNAVIFWLVGFSLVYFVVHEIGVSFQAAVLGHWKWKRTIKQIGDSRRKQRKLQRASQYANMTMPSSTHVTSDYLDARTSTGSTPSQQDLDDDDSNFDKHGDTRSFMLELFDDMDEDEDGNIDASELFQALSNAGVPIKKKEAKIMLRAADQDSNGVIDRDEWNDLVLRLFKKG